ncbi:MAG: hypothetical protein Q7R70_00580 [Candidatus Diapherotrites archaeon]|nr:hypothetical protein [Candidatus Diapherotrites archaeon]
MGCLSIVHWYDLPNSTNIRLSKQFQNELISTILGKTPKPKIKNLANLLRISTSQLQLYKCLKSNFSVATLVKICAAFSIDLGMIEKNIIAIGKKNIILDPKLPFMLNSCNAVALRSIINSEGHIPIVKGSTIKIRVAETELLEKSIQYAKTVFGEFNTLIKKTKGKNSFEVYFPTVIGDSLELSGITRGSKILQNTHIPEDIVNGSQQVKRAYLQWSFASEMENSDGIVKLTRHVDVTELLDENYISKLDFGANFNGKIPDNVKALLEKRKPNLLLGELQLLRDFGVYREPRLKLLWKTKRNSVSAAWNFCITNKNDLSILKDEIGLPLKEKQDKLVASFEEKYKIRENPSIC